MATIWRVWLANRAIKVSAARLIDGYASRTPEDGAALLPAETEMSLVVLDEALCELRNLPALRYQYRDETLEAIWSEFKRKLDEASQDRGWETRVPSRQLDTPDCRWFSRHTWNHSTCRCERCGVWRHDWEGCKCKRCGGTVSALVNWGHTWSESKCQCVRCGKEHAEISSQIPPRDGWHSRHSWCARCKKTLHSSRIHASQMGGYR